MSNDKELTSMLINALDNSSEGFKAFKSMFNICSKAFEIGDDALGLKTLGEIIPGLRDYSLFCADLLGSHSEIIESTLLKEMEEHCESFQNLLGEIVQEMEENNFVEVGDILKYDLGDILVKMADLFPKIATALKNSEYMTSVK
jgi:predicted solute-binding protein